MLRNIKSIYFIKIIFSYVNERKKLKLVKYNKILQKNLDINIINYQHFTGKYLIYEPNGIGKEYCGYDETLIFEGEYLNGERNGKGKEYDYSGILKFEGEYLNGERNGKGKEYDYNGNLNFEGEYLNGERNGKGKEYDYSGILKFEGEYLNGKRNGKGKEYDYNGNLIFEGEYLNGKKLLETKYDKKEKIINEFKNINEIEKKNNFNDDKSIFKGEYLIEKVKDYYYYDQLRYKIEYYSNDKRKGKGKEYSNYNGELEFEGEYLNKIRNGKGKEYYKNGQLKFEDFYLYGYKLKGKLYINHIEFEGNFLFNNKWHGKGFDKNGNIIYEIINGNGKVKEYFDDGERRFEGEYLNGKRNGKGKEYSNYNGELEFEGEYLNGKGKEYDYNGKIIFEGEYLNGKRNGIGKEYYYNGNLKFEGEYLNGERNGI